MGTDHERTVGQQAKSSKNKTKQNPKKQKNPKPKKPKISVSDLPVTLLRICPKQAILT